MMKFKDFKIGKKLFVTFGIIIALLVVVLGIGLFALISNGQKFDSFYDDGYEITNKVMEIRNAIQSSAKNIGYSMMTDSEVDTKTYIENARSQSTIMSDGVTTLKTEFTGDPG